MSDNILSAILVFSLMAGGTAAIGSEMIAGPRAAAPMKTVTLAPVTVIGHRATVLAADAVTLPTVTITGRRNAWTEVAVETHDVATKVE